jgi:flagellar biosynthesis protein FliR
MTEADLLASLPGMAFAFVLVLCRVGTAVMLLPGLGEVEMPAMVRAGFALALTVLVLPGVAGLVPAAPEDWSGAGMVGAELLTGAVLGWLARLPALALSMAGAIISYLLGLSSVLQPDPALGGQSTALARLFGLVAPVLILSTGLYALPLSALIGSYATVGPGGALPAGGVVEMLLTVAAQSLGLALQLSAPFLLAGFVWQVAMGLLARLVPQLQVYSAAAPGQILGGMVLLSLLVTRLLSAWADGLSTSWAALPGS